MGEDLTKGIRPGRSWDVLSITLVGLGIALVGTGLAFGPLASAGGGAAVWLVMGKSLALAGGGLVHLWVARKFFSENIRRYRAMAALFAGADETMGTHLETLENEGDSAAGGEAVGAIQDLLVTVGVEALAENAEWLLMHRDRRVNPVSP